MSKPRQSRAAGPRPASAVDLEMLAQYRRAARTPSEREDVRALGPLAEHYELLVMSGDGGRALGVGLEIIDVALRIAATPSSTEAHWTYKQEFFERFFASMTQSLGQPHVASIANAAVAVERALRAQRAKSRH